MAATMTLVEATSTDGSKFLVYIGGRAQSSYKLIITMVDDDNVDDDGDALISNLQLILVN